jgi:hypothetical protein
MSSRQIINSMLKDKSITSYLEEKGISCVRDFSGKKVYRCPLHEGDNDPSFTVYMNGEEEHQTFYCFGCSEGGSLIQLVSAFEKTPVKDIIRNLTKDIKITDEGLLSSIIIDLEELGKIYPVAMERTLIQLVRLCYHYLESVHFDKNEVDFFTSIFQKVDQVVKESDTSALEEIYDFLSTIGIQQRCSKYNNRIEQEILESAEENTFWETI